MRPAAADRFASAAELRSFWWALGELSEPWDVVAKLEADLRLPPATVAAVEAAFREDPRLGVAVPRLLSVVEAGRNVSHRTRMKQLRRTTRSKAALSSWASAACSRCRVANRTPTA